jgi:predicted SprT family Zn-dependent metalloprotease
MPPDLEHEVVAIFDSLNAAHFGGELPRPKFMQSALLAFGYYMSRVHIIALHPRTLQQDRKYIADTVLHELVHYALELRTGDHDKDHGKAFVDLANEIGASLGLPAVCEGNAAVLEWPQSVRPADYAPWRKVRE